MVFSRQVFLVRALSTIRLTRDVDTTHTFLFCGSANSTIYFRFGNCNKMPRLPVRSARRSAGRIYEGFDNRMQIKFAREVSLR